MINWMVFQVWKPGMNFLTRLNILAIKRNVDFEFRKEHKLLTVEVRFVSLKPLIVLAH